MAGNPRRPGRRAFSTRERNEQQSRSGRVTAGRITRNIRDFRASSETTREVAAEDDDRGDSSDDHDHHHSAPKLPRGSADAVPRFVRFRSRRSRGRRSRQPSPFTRPPETRRLSHQGEGKYQRRLGGGGLSDNNRGERRKAMHGVGGNEKASRTIW